jgi:hypothetical protein
VDIVAKKNLQIEMILDGLKNEISAEMGIEQLNGDTPSRVCGQVGGEMTRRLIAIAEDLLQQNKLQ